MVAELHTYILPPHVPSSTQKQQGKKKKRGPNGGAASFSALHLLNDPQDFAEKLFKQLERSSRERFEVRLMVMCLISRLVGVHQVCSTVCVCVCVCVCVVGFVGVGGWVQCNSLPNEYKQMHVCECTSSHLASLYEVRTCTYVCVLYVSC